jgi:hypothetical protein
VETSVKKLIALPYQRVMCNGICIINRTLDSVIQVTSGKPRGHIDFGWSLDSLKGFNGPECSVMNGSSKKVYVSRIVQTHGLLYSAIEVQNRRWQQPGLETPKEDGMFPNFDELSKKLAVGITNAVMGIRAENRHAQRVNVASRILCTTYKLKGKLTDADYPASVEAADKLLGALKDTEPKQEV